jgi:ribosomal protein S5
MQRSKKDLIQSPRLAVSPHPPQNGVFALTIIAVFLVGIGIGDMLSKSKQANTNYAVVFSRLAEAPP